MTGLDQGGQGSIVIRDIHQSTAVAIISRNAIILAKIENVRGIEHVVQQMGIIQNTRNAIMANLDEIYWEGGRRCVAENTFALVVYSRGDGSPFPYGNQEISPAANPEILRAILVHLEGPMALRNHVTFGTFVVLSNPITPYLIPGQEAMRFPGPILVSPDKGNLLIERKAGSRPHTDVWLEDTRIRDHPV